MSGREPWFAALRRRLKYRWKFGTIEAKITVSDERLIAGMVPRLYVEGMLDDAERVGMADAREAIFTRLGAVLLSTYGICPTLREFDRGPREIADELAKPEWEWRPTDAQEGAA